MARYQQRLKQKIFLFSRKIFIFTNAKTSTTAPLAIPVSAHVTETKAKENSRADNSHRKLSRWKGGIVRTGPSTGNGPRDVFIFLVVDLFDLKISHRLFLRDFVLFLTSRCFLKLLRAASVRAPSEILCESFEKFEI